MNPVRQVAKPPSTPLMIYDGDCAFCRSWIARWQRRTGGHVVYQPYQAAEIAAQFPEIPREQFETAVQLIAPDASVCSGAQAVFRSLNFASQAGWLWQWYRRSKTFAWLTEWGYRFIARHRRFFSALTKAY